MRRRNGRVCGRQCWRSAICAIRSKGPRGPAAGYGPHGTIYLAGQTGKRTGKPCRAPAMPNGRCKVHGGKSTGPRTPEGLERSRRAN
jgi:hypothetical protein